MSEKKKYAVYLAIQPHIRDSADGHCQFTPLRMNHNYFCLISQLDAYEIM